MNKVAVLLGSNLNDRVQLISAAIELISNKVGKLVSQSPIYETPAWGFESNNNFLNQVIVITSDNDANTILKLCLSIEKELGRTRKVAAGYSDRTIDIDILLFNEEIIDTEDLTVPHPKMHERIFCLQPLNDVASDWNVPTFNKTVGELLTDCTDSSNIKKYGLKI